MDDNNKFPSNSVRTQERRPEPEPVKDVRVTKTIAGSAKKKEKTFANKVAEIFIPEDITDVKSYLWDKIFVPTTKKLLLDTVETFLGVTPSNRRDYSRVGSSPSYRNFYDDRNGANTSDSRSRSASMYRFYEYEIDDPADAYDAKDELDNMLAKYGSVRVADYCEILKVPMEYTWNDYGWYDLRGMYVERSFNGRCILKMPRPVPLRN